MCVCRWERVASICSPGCLSGCGKVSRSTLQLTSLQPPHLYSLTYLLLLLLPLSANSTHLPPDLRLWEVANKRVLHPPSTWQVRPYTHHKKLANFHEMFCTITGRYKSRFLPWDLCIIQWGHYSLLELGWVMRVHRHSVVALPLWCKRRESQHSDKPSVCGGSESLTFRPIPMYASTPNTHTHTHTHTHFHILEAPFLLRIQLQCTYIIVE